MSPHMVPSALISTDEGFRDLLRQVLLSTDRSTRLDYEITIPLLEIGAEHLTSLREAAPDLVFLDFNGNPRIAIRFARFLADAAPTMRFIGCGPPLDPELLLEAMQAGISEYLPKPVTAEQLVAAVERAERKLGVQAAPAAARTGELLSFFGAKGGAGCTTVATNVAVQLHKLTGRKTLVVDLDLELGEVALFFGTQPRFSFVDLVRNFHRMDAQLLSSYIETHPSGVHLLSAPFQPQQAATVSMDQIESVLHFLKQHYGYVIVDTQASFSPATLASFRQSDQIFVVANVDLPSIRNIKRGMPLIERSAPRGREAVRLVVNRYRAAAPITIDEVEGALGIPAYARLCNEYETVIGAINSGQPIVLASRQSAYAQQLRDLTAAIAGLSVEPRRNGPGFHLRMLKLFGGKQEMGRHE